MLDDAAVIKTGDACKLLNICKRTLYRLVANEELPVIKMPVRGKRHVHYMYRFSRADLLSWIDQKKVNVNVQPHGRNGHNGVVTVIQKPRNRARRA